MKNGDEQFIPDVRKAIDSWFNQDTPYRAGMLAVELVKIGREEFISDIKEAIEKSFSKDGPRWTGNLAIEAVKTTEKNLLIKR